MSTWCVLPKPYLAPLKFNVPRPFAGYDRLMADATKYRDEAERLRREAIETPDRDIRGTMIEVADHGPGVPAATTENTKKAALQTRVCVSASSQPAFMPYPANAMRRPARR